MENVRTVTPSKDTAPTIGINLLKVIEDNVPVRLREIETEHKQLQAQLVVLQNESVKLKKLLDIVQN